VKQQNKEREGGKERRRGWSSLFKSGVKYGCPRHHCPIQPCIHISE